MGRRRRSWVGGRGEAYPSVFGLRPCGMGGLGNGRAVGLFSDLCSHLMPTPPTIITTLAPVHKLKVIQPHVIKGKTPAHHQTSCRLPHSSGHPRSFLLCTPPPHKLRADLQPGCPRSPLLFITQPRPPPPWSPCWNPGPSLQTAWSSWSSSIPLLPPCLVKQLTHPVLILYSAAHHLSLRPSCALCGVCCVCLTCLLPATIVCVCVWGNYPRR